MAGDLEYCSWSHNLRECPGPQSTYQSKTSAQDQEQDKCINKNPAICSLCSPIKKDCWNLTLTFLWWIPLSSFCKTTFLSSLFSFSRRSSIRWYFIYKSIREMEYKMIMNNSSIKKLQALVWKKNLNQWHTWVRRSSSWSWSILSLSDDCKHKKQCSRLWLMLFLFMTADHLPNIPL